MQVNIPYMDPMGYSYSGYNRTYPFIYKAIYNFLTPFIISTCPPRRRLEYIPRQFTGWHPPVSGVPAVRFWRGCLLEIYGKWISEMMGLVKDVSFSNVSLDMLNVRGNIFFALRTVHPDVPKNPFKFRLGEIYTLKIA